MNDSIEKSVYMIQSEMFDIRENITDGPNLIINNELLNIHRRNKELEIQLEEHGKKTNELEIRFSVVSSFHTSKLFQPLKFIKPRLDTNASAYAFVAAPCASVGSATFLI